MDYNTFMIRSLAFSVIMIDYYLSKQEANGLGNHYLARKGVFEATLC